MSDQTQNGGEPAEPPIAVGDVLAGKYRVEKVLGQGAMGIVVAAMHVHLEERVALKFLRSEMAGKPEIVARFLREAQSSVRIKGEHVARVSDVGTLDSGAPYMVMEYLDGRDLGVMLDGGVRLPLDVAVDFMIQASEAVAEAHALGIVHRDLKPSNLFVATRGDGSPLVKVLDFGIAKLLNDTKVQLTAMGAVMGSPMYMSPEQLLNAQGVDRRSDIWQLGAIFYEALAGKPAFDGATMSQIMIAIGVNPAPRLRDAVPEAPPELEALILKCLEKDIDKRLPDVAAFAEGLLPFATTRRAQVSVEHIVTLLRGAQAAAALPAMRAPLRSGASLLEHASVDRLAIAAAVGIGVGTPAGAASASAFAATSLATSEPGAAAPIAPSATRAAQAAAITVNLPPKAPATANAARPGDVAASAPPVTAGVPGLVKGIVVAVLAGIVAVVVMMAMTR